MANDRNKIFNQAIEIIKDKNIFFIEHLINYLPISKPTFYDYFKVDSNEFNTIKEAIEANKTSSCNNQLNQWLESGNPTLQIAAYKQICTDDQRRALSTNWNENNHSGQISIIWNEEKTY